MLLHGENPNYPLALWQRPANAPSAGIPAHPGLGHIGNSVSVFSGRLTRAELACGLWLRERNWKCWGLVSVAGEGPSSKTFLPFRVLVVYLVAAHAGSPPSLLMNTCRFIFMDSKWQPSLWLAVCSSEAYTCPEWWAWVKNSGPRTVPLQRHLLIWWLKVGPVGRRFPYWVDRYQHAQHWPGSFQCQNRGEPSGAATRGTWLKADRLGTPRCKGNRTGTLEVGFQKTRGQWSSSRSPHNLGLLRDKGVLCLHTQAVSEAKGQCAGSWLDPATHHLWPGTMDLTLLHLSLPVCNLGWWSLSSPQRLIVETKQDDSYGYSFRTVPGWE